MSAGQLKERQALESWEKLCRSVEQEDFSPVSVEPNKKAIRFEYSSGRELAWQVGGALSLFLAVGLAAVFSVPLGFLVTAIFVVLSRTTDDYFLWDAEIRSLCHVRTFAGRVVRESLVEFDEIESVHVVPVSQRSGSTSWIEYCLEVQSKDGESYAVLTHTESRSRPLAHRIGEALAEFLGVSLVGLQES